MNQFKLKRDLMWPTPIYFKDFPDSKNLNKQLFKHIKAWAQREPTLDKTNSGGGWHSPTDMNHKPEYKLLCDHLFVMMHEIFKDYGMEPKVGLGNMWANINPPNAYNKYHIHPNSDFSGVYYIQVPKDSGCLWLEDPRPGANIQLPRRVKNLPVVDNNTKAKGDKSLRVSVSFNFIQTSNT